MVDSSIPQCHLNTLLPSFDEGLKDGTHRGVEELLDQCSLLALREPLQVHFIAREITNEDACMLRGFTAKSVRKIAKHHVDGIGRFAARELRELHLVCCNNYRRNGSTDRQE